MADAWSTPGWTCTNGIPLTSDLPPALVPADVNMVDISTEFASIDGKWQTGYVLFEASCDLTHIPTGGVSTTPSWLGRLYNGAMSISIPATDNTVLSPSGWYYKVTTIIYGTVSDLFYAYIPYTLAPLDFTQIQQVPDPTLAIVDPMILDGGTA